MKQYFFITIGALIVAIGLCFFLIPADLAVGGVTGLSMIVHQVFPSISTGTALIGLNIILFAIGFLIIGKAFGTKTIYASFLLSGFVYIFDTWFKLDAPLVSDLLVNLIVGILIQGIGMGIVFNQNASTGGTDIIAKILNQFFHLEIGKALLAADVVVVSLAAFTFGFELAIYALLGIIFNGFIIDNVIEGFTFKVSVSIISSETGRVQKFIVEDLNRGATIYTAKGAYTMSDKIILNSVMNRKEFIRLKRYIRSIDPNAFVMISTVREVLGEGFLS